MADMEAAVTAVVGMASVEVVAEDTEDTEAAEGTVLMVVVEEAAVEVDVERGTVVEDTAAEVDMAEEVVETVTIAESRGIWLGIAIRAEAAAGGMVVEVEEGLATIVASRGILRENAQTAR